MDRNRFYSLMIGSVLAIAAIISAIVFKPSARSEASARPYAGMGDLRLSEAQLSIPVTGQELPSRSYAGMGDLHQLESQLSIPVSGLEGSNRSYAGMGDLRASESQRGVSAPGAVNRNSQSIGTRDAWWLEEVNSSSSKRSNSKYTPILEGGY